MERESVQVHLEKFLLEVSSKAIVKIINLSIHAFHMQETFSQDSHVRALEKLVCFTSTRDSIEGIQFVSGELMENKHYFQIQAWFSSEILRSFQSDRYSLLHSEWFIFLPVLGHETLDEIELRKQSQEPDELVYRGPAANQVRIRSLESSEIKKDLKILCTSFDTTYHGEQEVSELIENFGLIYSN